MASTGREKFSSRTSRVVIGAKKPLIADSLFILCDEQAAHARNYENATNQAFDRLPNQRAPREIINPWLCVYCRFIELVHIPLTLHVSSAIRVTRVLMQAALTQATLAQRLNEKLNPLRRYPRPCSKESRAASGRRSDTAQRFHRQG